MMERERERDRQTSRQSERERERERKEQNLKFGKVQELFRIRPKVFLPQREKIYRVITINQYKKSFSLTHLKLSAVLYYLKIIYRRG